MEFEFRLYCTKCNSTDVIYNGFDEMNYPVFKCLSCENDGSFNVFDYIVLN